jgi:hypothetical protein
MYGIKSRQGRWSVSPCSCSDDTAHFHYGNVVLHISREDLHDLGLAMQRVAESTRHPESEDGKEPKRGLVQ